MTAPGADPPVIEGWRHVVSGKVRDLYEPVDGDPTQLLVVASDRISALDRVLSPGIPGKGAVLTAVARWWFGRLDGVPNHLLPDAPPPAVAERAMVVRRLAMFPVEAVVRGYLAGSGWAEYSAAGTVCGIRLPGGLREGDRLPHPIYTPAFKAPVGEHDENITFERTVELIGEAGASAVRDASLTVFARASELAAERGILLADTKFEFGEDADGQVTLGDEVLTPDSSRFWDAGRYAAGGADRLDSLDKQPVRDWLTGRGSRGHGAGGAGEAGDGGAGDGTADLLPPDVVAHTAARYAELRARLLGA